MQRSAKPMLVQIATPMLQQWLLVCSAIRSGCLLYLMRTAALWVLQVQPCCCGHGMSSSLDPLCVNFSNKHLILSTAPTSVKPTSDPGVALIFIMSACKAGRTSIGLHSSGWQSVVTIVLAVSYQRMLCVHKKGASPSLCLPAMTAIICKASTAKQLLLTRASNSPSADCAQPELHALLTAVHT